ncbi:MAG: 50S ribosomal protein L25/general stress protein Ctc [Proteobacteria bacterium]|nr:50S ribosomal protein L25/general stress protein Ctc [Pseudomonadota bacterium]MDA0880951.1 50S ribosomal protein L25/general stress protein Ctc [Pseudomonadota bacterium]
MSNEIILNADLRIRTGTNKTREIRREDSMVPAIIYGNEQESKNIKVKLNELTKASKNELFYTQVLLIKLEGQEEKVVLKELQREPVKGKFLHADFLRVSGKTKLKVVVPFRFIGEDNCEGVKTDGGVIAKAMSEIEIACLAGNIPEAIEIDITNLMLHEAIRLTELKLPEGAEIPGLDAAHDQMVVSVNAPRVEAEIAPEGEATEEASDAKDDEGSADNPEESS